MESQSRIKRLPKVKLLEVTWKNAFIWFLASQSFYFVMLFITIPKVEQYASKLKVFDLMPEGYSYEYAVKLLKALGEEGRSVYLLQQIPLDMIYPTLMGVTGILFIQLFLNHLKFNYSYLTYLPVIAAIFDYLENIMLISILHNYPRVSSLQINIASLFTVIKSTFTVLYLTVLIVLLIMVLYNFYKKRQGRNE